MANYLTHKGVLHDIDRQHMEGREGYEPYWVYECACGLAVGADEEHLEDYIPEHVRWCRRCQQLEISSSPEGVVHIRLGHRLEGHIETPCQRPLPSPPHDPPSDPCLTPSPAPDRAATASGRGDLSP